jgi:hypothetical protein
MSSIEVTKRPVGRPKKIMQMKEETLPKEPILKKPVGRPKLPPKPIDETRLELLSSINRLRPLRDNKDEFKTKDIQQYRKQYYESNKEKFIADIVCIACNVKYQKANKTRHLKSKSHLKNVCNENLCNIQFNN